MKKIIIWRGSHGKEIFDLVQSHASSSDSLLILCPPRIDDLSSYFPFLPAGMVEFKGELKDKPSFINHSSVNYPEFPTFGLFTSGTTDARAKLILYSKKNLDSACEGIFSFFKDLKIEHVYSYPQPYHIFGLSLGYFAALKFNWKLSFGEGNYSRDHHAEWIKEIDLHGHSLLTLGTPTHFLDANTYIKEKNIKMKSSLTSIAGGAKVEISLWDAMQSELRIMSPSIGYGCSEASPGVTHLPPGLKPSIDGDLGFILPNGGLTETSEGFYYEGDNVCLGIIQNDEITFPKKKYLLNDILEQAEDGHYYFKKRSHLTLNRGGEKFSLEEIENEIKRAFKINSVAVPVKDQRLGEELGLVFESKLCTAEEIQEQLKSVFKRQFNKAFMLGVSQLPINESAKFDRKKCLELIGEL